MANFTDLTGLAGVASAIAAAALLLPWTIRLTQTRLAVVLGTVFVLSLIPFGTLPVAAYVRGITGDLSITTLVLLWCALLRPWCGCAASGTEHRRVLLALVALCALAFYPMALGAGSFDPYRLGYGNPLFIVVLLLIALAAWFRGFTLIALCIALATLAWAAGWYESNNLWDYLLDPFVSVYALAATVIFGVKRLSKSRRRNKLPQ